jgi:hypothetical protein
MLEKRVNDFQKLLRMTYSHPLFRELSDRGDKESYMLARELPMMAEEFLGRFLNERRLMASSESEDRDDAKKERSKKSEKSSPAGKK